MVDLKQRKVVLSFYVFGNSFLTKVIPLLPPSYTICKAQKRKVEMSSGAAGNDEFMMITEGVRVSFTSLSGSVGLLLGSAVMRLGGRRIGEADATHRTF